MTKATWRRSRKERVCVDCRRTINKGELYLDHVVSPHDSDVGNEHWWRSVECGTCADRYKEFRPPRPDLPRAAQQ